MIGAFKLGVIAAAIRVAEEGGGGDDPIDWSKVKLFIRGIGANNGTTFSDSSVHNRTVTGVANVKTSTAQTKFLSSSIYFDGSGDYLFVDGMALTLPITIMAHIYPTNSSKRIGWIDSGPGQSNVIRNYPNNLIEHQQDGANRVTFEPPVNQWTWNQLMIDTVGGFIRFNYSRDGVMVSQATTTRTTWTQGSTFVFGAINNGGDGSFEGYMSEVMVVEDAIDPFLPEAELAPPSEHRYWRFKSINTGDYLEISELQLFEGATQRTGTVTASDVPTNALSTLTDGNLSSRCYWTAAVAEGAGFWIQFDFGAGNAYAIDGFKQGGFDNPGRYMIDCTVEYSDNGTTWTTKATKTGLTYPGNNTLSAIIPL